MTPFLSVHRRPETIFVPAYRVHPNGVERVVGITCVSLDPAADAAFFGLLAETEPTPVDGGFRLDLACGDSVTILEPEAVRARFGSACPPLPTEGSGFGVAMTLRCRSLDRCVGAIDPAIPITRHAESVVVPATFASGVALEMIDG
jgi:hypothetical protein